MGRLPKIGVCQKRMEELGRYVNRNHLVQWVKYENKCGRYNPAIKISYSLQESFEWHHVDMCYVVAVPKKLHRSIWHNLINKESMDRINDEIEKWYKTKYNMEFEFKNKFLYIHL